MIFAREDKIERIKEEKALSFRGTELTPIIAILSLYLNSSRS